MKQNFIFNANILEYLESVVSFINDSYLIYCFIDDWIQLDINYLVSQIHRVNVSTFLLFIFLHQISMFRTTIPLRISMQMYVINHLRRYNWKQSGVGIYYHDECSIDTRKLMDLRTNFIF